MARDSYQWWEVTSDYIQIKFVDSLDSTTLINDNIHLYTVAGSPTVVSEPFKAIDIKKDFSSISRMLTLWWEEDLTLPTNSYILEFENLKDFVGNDVQDFNFTFEWESDFATPNQDLRPTREPIEVEDYSIKTPGWSILDPGSSSSTSSSSGIQLVDVSPDRDYGYSLAANENDGVIQILFDRPIASNYITSEFFVLSSKDIKKGISQWTSVQALIVDSYDSKLINIYLPGTEIVESATPPSGPQYSYTMTSAEIANNIFFAPSKKYRLVIAAGIGSP